MKRFTALLALLATGCATMEPHLGKIDPAIAPSWPVGDAYLKQSEAALPAVTYRQILRDARLQTLIAQALVNNRNLMIAASNIAAAREQYRIQRAQQFPQLDAGAGVTVTGERTNSTNTTTPTTSSSKVVANYTAGLSVPSFELDLFGRLRSLTHAQLELYFATEAGARATRLTLVADIANAWLSYA
ncbi:MAG: outer membrane protein multidrug efflux system, partial [Sphingomonadales bacterium]|nr:outer membrane protein multidrug efflux system [Sphingomonadales bacterium]